MRLPRLHLRPKAAHPSVVQLVKPWINVYKTENKDATAAQSRCQERRAA